MVLRVLDGGMASILESQFNHNLNNKLWSSIILKSNPLDIIEAHKLYIEAGADIITTCSYQSSFDQFKSIGLDDVEINELLILPMKLAIEARSKFKWNIDIAFSISSYGALLANGAEYTGDFGGITIDQLYKIQSSRFAPIIESEHIPDYLLFETIPSINEIKAILMIDTKIPIWISLYCKSSMCLGDGTSFNEALDTILESGKVSGIGINCLNPSLVDGLIANIYSKVCYLDDKIEIICYPNSGERYCVENKSWEKSKLIDWKDLTKRCIENGATIVGGCCRIGPREIRLISQVIKPR